MRYCPYCYRHVRAPEYRIHREVTGWDDNGLKVKETLHPCPTCGNSTLSAAWVSIAVWWKPWTWGCGHWQFDYQSTGPTRWWRRFKVQTQTTETEDG